MARIINSETLTKHYAAHVIEAREIANEAAAGHLLMARFGEQSLFTPHAIADIDREAGSVTVVCHGGALEIETTVELTGPVGQPDVIQSSGRVLCVAEDLGVAAAHPRLAQYKKRGAYTILIAGFPTRDHVYWLDRIEPLCDELFVVTEDGSFGVKGPIRHTVKAVAQLAGDVDRAVLIGSLAMMKACARITSDLDITTTASLAAVINSEEQMRPLVPQAVLAGSADEDSAFDWHAAADLDAHKVDFDRLGVQLGLQPTK